MVGSGWKPGMIGLPPTAHRFLSSCPLSHQGSHDVPGARSMIAKVACGMVTASGATEMPGAEARSATGWPAGGPRGGRGGGGGGGGGRGARRGGGGGGARPRGKNPPRGFPIILDLNLVEARVG